MSTYSSVTRRRNRANAAMTAGNVYFFSIGIRACRSSGVGAWSESARRNCSGRWASFARLGKMPTVETVMCRAPIARRRLVEKRERPSTASQLSSGSPYAHENDIGRLSAASSSMTSRT